jgi:glucosamine--fructose-6-phosphate aminotransferase (isomerizing)
MPDRSSHPFHMHDAIFAQPECITRALAAQRDAILHAAAQAAARKRIWIAGIGTSFHAAMVTDYCLRHFMRGAGAAVVQSFEFVHYPRELRADDVVLVVSHRGWKSYSAQALAAARAAGALTIAFTGQGGDESMRRADHLIATCEQEQSAAHTKSYTSALACLAVFAIHLAQGRGFVTPDDAQRAEASVNSTPGFIRIALQVEAQARAMAAPLAKRARWMFLGAGPNWATAREGALKVKETSYLTAEGFQIEQFLHGPIAEVDERSAVIAHLAGGPGDYRIVAALRAAGEIGALRVLVASHGAAPGEPVAEHLLEAPASGEWLSPLLHVVPVQLLAYYAALERGSNPDTCRRDQPAHSRARQHFDL